MQITIEANGNQELGTIYYGMTIKLEVPGSIHYVYDLDFVEKGILEVLKADQDLAKGKEITFQKIKQDGLQNG